MSELIQFDGRTVAVIAPEDLEALEAEVEALREVLREWCACAVNLDNGEAVAKVEQSFVARSRAMSVAQGSGE